MKGVPKISVVTPSYNQGQFIEETIKSVLSQEGDFFIEYMIMDGGSTDDSVEVIKKYDRLLKEKKWPLKCRGVEYSWVSEKDKGQTDAVNKGFRAATGEILGWLNSDDTYLPGAFAKVVEYFGTHDDVMMAYGEGYYISKEGDIMERYPTEPFDIKRLAETCFICQPSVFMRRDVPDEAGYLDDGLNYCMDYEYWIRIAKKGLKIGFIPEYLANSRLYAETKTMSRSFEVHKEIVRSIKMHYGRVPNSWIYGYACSQAERWLKMDKDLKNRLFLFTVRLIYIYRSVQINRSLFGMR